MAACSARLALVLIGAGLAACQPKGAGPSVADGSDTRPSTAEGSTTGASDGASSRRTGDGNGGPNTRRSAGESDATPAQTARRPEGSEPRDAPRDQSAGTAPQGAPVDADPQQFLGAEQERVSARLGRPTHRRVEASARVWQYRLDQCVLDVVLYPDKDGIRAAHLEARDRTGQTIPTGQCLERVLRHRRAATN